MRATSPMICPRARARQPSGAGDRAARADDGPTTERRGMRQLSKVVWAEGMHLSQHHFQTQTRYFEDTIHFALSQLFRESLGVAGIELDAEALRNGTVSVLHARGVMPDGLPFNIPHSDPGPAPRAIADVFLPTQDSHLV